jgi:hypothetical protein
MMALLPPSSRIDRPRRFATLEATWFPVFVDPVKLISGARRSELRVGRLVVGRQGHRDRPDPAFVASHQNRQPAAVPIHKTLSSRLTEAYGCRNDVAHANHASLPC